VKYPVIADTNFDELRDVVLPNMNKFSIIGDELSTSAHIKNLAKLMPNLKELHVGLANDGFGMVCKVWNKLENLQIHPFQVDERGLLGTEFGEKCYHTPNITDLQGKSRNFDGK